MLSPATNSSCHRRRRILATVRTRSGQTCHRRLGTSNGCQDHTVLPYARNVVRPARLAIAHEDQPALRPRLRADALASTTSRTTFVTIAIRPSCRNGTNDLKPLIWGRCEAQSCPSCHCAATRRAVVIPGRAGMTRVICPTGKSPKPCLPPVAKINRFAFDPKHLYERTVSCPHRGAYHGRHETLARDAVDAGGIEDERYRCGRQSRVVLAPDAGVKSCGVHPQGDGGKQARSPGRARNKP